MWHVRRIAYCPLQHPTRLLPLFTLIALLCLPPYVGHAEDIPLQQREQAQQMLEQVRQRAIDLIIDASRGEDPYLRANAIEAMQARPDRALPLAQLGLRDDEPVVQFSALVTIGRLRLHAASDSVKEHLQANLARQQQLQHLYTQQQATLSAQQRQRMLRQLIELRSVQAAAIFALSMCGSEVDLSPLASMMGDDHPAVRSNVAMLLGWLGDDSAVPMMREMSVRPMRQANPVQQAVVRVQIAEALATLGDQDSLTAIRAAAYSMYDEVRVLSVQTLGRLGDRSMQPALKAMLDKQLPEQAPELNLAAAASLAQLGDYAGLPTLIRGANSRTIQFQGRTADAATIRVQAAAGLAAVPAPQAAQTLINLLDDPSKQVRLAAAAAILNANAAW